MKLVATSSVLGAFLIVWAGTGCTTGELSSEGTPPDAAVPTGSAPLGEGVDDAPPGVVRTVETRNPVGVPINNLMYDGDFELSISPGPQGLGYWYALGGVGPMTLTVESGGFCRSGLHCGVLKPGMVLYGRGAAAPDGALHDVSMWVRPADDLDRCKVAEPYVLPCDQFSVLSALELVNDDPNEAGWCEYRGEYPPSENAICVYVEAALLPGESALIDSVVLLPKGAANPQSGPAPKSGPASKSGSASKSGTGSQAAVGPQAGIGRTPSGFRIGSPESFMPQAKADRMKSVIEYARQQMPFSKPPRAFEQDPR